MITKSLQYAQKFGKARQHGWKQCLVSCWRCVKRDLKAYRSELALRIQSVEASINALANDITVEQISGNPIATLTQALGDGKHKNKRNEISKAVYYVLKNTTGSLSANSILEELKNANLVEVTDTTIVQIHRGLDRLTKSGMIERTKIEGSATVWSIKK